MQYATKTNPIKIKSHIICFGELLIDMISTTNGNLISSSGFLKKFGGAPANTAAGLAKLGDPTIFIGKVGDDPFGHFLERTLNNIGVNTQSLILSPDDKTTLAFVSLTEKGQRDFFFYKGAHENIKQDEVNLPENAFILHFGSLTQIKKDSFEATLKLINQAREQNVIISYDPNIRESLWVDMKRAKKIILDTARTVDIFKISESEATFLSGSKNIQESANILFSDNLQALFITLGKKGCYFKTKKFEGEIPVPIEVKTVDTTGAGDAFNAGYISSLFALQKTIDQMTEEEIKSILRRANTIASLTTTKKGAISAFPTEQELKKYNL